MIIMMILNIYESNFDLFDKKIKKINFFLNILFHSKIFKIYFYYSFKIYYFNKFNLLFLF
jgi:hypothetical protein